MEELEPQPHIENTLLPQAVLESREYEIKLNNDIYTLKIDLKSKETFGFILKQTNTINVYKYINEFSKDKLISNLELIKSKYLEPTKIFTFFDTTFSKNKLELKNHNDKEKMILKIIRTIDSEDTEYCIQLIKASITQEELVKIIIEEIHKMQNKSNNENLIIIKKSIEDIKTLMDNKCKAIDQKISDINNSININKNELSDLTKEI